MTYSICLASPLKRQYQTYNSTHQKCGAEEVQLYQLLSPGYFCCVLLGDLEAESNENHGGATNWQIYIEAPSPCDVRCKGAADQGTDDRGNAKKGAEKSLDLRTFMERHGMNDAHYLRVRLSAISTKCRGMESNYSASEDTSSADSTDRSSDYKGD